MQAAHIRELYGDSREAAEMVAILRADIMGQLEYQNAHDGPFPTNQFALAVAYLADNKAATQGES